MGRRRVSLQDHQNVEVSPPGKDNTNVNLDPIDQRFKQALLALELVSHVAAAPLSPSTSHSKPGTIEPAGDTTPAVFRIRYLRARAEGNTRQRLTIVRDIEREVATIRHPPKTTIVGETEVERRKRIVTATEGSTPKEVEQSSVGVLARTIIKWRKIEGRDPENGKPLTTGTLTPEARRQRILDLEAAGHAPPEIALMLQVHRMTVHRALDLARRAA